MDIDTSRKDSHIIFITILESESILFLKKKNNSKSWWFPGRSSLSTLTPPRVSCPQAPTPGFMDPTGDMEIVWGCNGDIIRKNIGYGMIWDHMGSYGIMRRYFGDNLRYVHSVSDHISSTLRITRRVDIPKANGAKPRNSWPPWLPLKSHSVCHDNLICVIKKDTHVKTC